MREDERSRLARELHDELGALLTAAKLDVGAPQVAPRRDRDARGRPSGCAHLNEALNSGIALKRRIIEDLRPSSLSNLGLVAALEILLREFGARSEIEVDCELEPVQLEPAAELTDLPTGPGGADQHRQVRQGDRRSTVSAEARAAAAR